MGVTETLARFIAQTRYEGIPDGAVQRPESLALLTDMETLGDVSELMAALCPAAPSTAC